LLTIAIVSTFLTGCSCNSGDTTLPASSTTVTTTPRGVTGTIILGANVDLGSEKVGTEGGGITISRPGDPLDGMTIGVPPEAYPGTLTYKISHAPVTSHTFGDDFIAASPMITVDNGGAYADQIISVRVPVKIPDGHVAMGFFYDSAAKKLEGMELLEIYADSITVGTRHFSSFLIGMIEKTKLKDVVDSGFWPGVDDWQFTNRGSYIAPGGHCEGQSIAAMWYYSTKPDGEDACLYNRYDNNGNQPATPDLWEDDSYGYRFCSVIQEDIDYNSFANKLWPQIAGRSWQKVDNKWQWVNVPKLISDETTRDLFAFTIQMTDEPQEVVVKSESGEGHAMICYRVTKDTLYIADPNYPGNLDRKIELVNKTFKPYNSGANKDEIDAGRGKNFEHIIYQAKSTIIDWNDIAKRWTEFKAGTTGNDKFPQYKTYFKEEKGQHQELLDGSVCTTKKIWIGNLFQGEATASVGGVWRGGKWLIPGADGYFYLNPGNNLLGILVDRVVGNAYEYVDFKYINVVYNDPTIAQPVEIEIPDSVGYAQTIPVNILINDAKLRDRTTYINVEFAEPKQILAIYEGLPIQKTYPEEKIVPNYSQQEQISMAARVTASPRSIQRGKMIVSFYEYREINEKEYHDALKAMGEGGIAPWRPFAFTVQNRYYLETKLAVAEKEYNLVDSRLQMELPAYTFQLSGQDPYETDFRASYQGSGTYFDTYEINYRLDYYDPAKGITALNTKWEEAKKLEREETDYEKSLLIYQPVKMDQTLLEKLKATDGFIVRDLKIPEDRGGLTGLTAHFIYYYLSGGNLCTLEIKRVQTVNTGEVNNVIEILLEEGKKMAQSVQIIPKEGAGIDYKTVVEMP
jgi:hypothetical protein